MTGRVRRTCIVLTLLALSLFSFPTVVRAHGGEVVYAGPVGSFDVEAVDRVVETGEGLIYTLTIRDAVTERPVAEADVRLTARFDGRTIGPRTATYFGNQYQTLIADEGAETVKVEVTILADGERTSFSHEVAGSGANPPRPWLPVLGATGGALALLAGLIRQRARRPTQERVEGSAGHPARTPYRPTPEDTP